MTSSSDSTPSAQDVLLHPLTSSSFGNMVRLAGAYGCEPRYLPRLAYLLFMTFLRQPVIWWEAARYGRRIRQQTIETPVFIIGHWRSGTTHLQNVMSEDPQFARVTLLQAGMPHDFLTLSDFAQRHFASRMPKKRLMDNVPVAAEVPWEEELALTSTGRMSFYHVSFFPKCMDRVFDEAVMFKGGDPSLQELWRKQYLAFLRKVQFVQPGKPLLLKNPANTARIDLLLEMFPGARFIHIHRNPYEVFTSTVHLYTKAQQAWGLHRSSRKRIVDHVLRVYPELMNAFFRQRERIPMGSLVEVSFQSLVDEPLDTLSTIYSTLGLPQFEEVKPRFEAYLESQRDYKRNKLTLDPQEKERVGSQWKEIFEWLGYAG